MIFGNLILNHVVSQALAEKHPTRDYDHCINRRQVKNPCLVCAEICPQKVYFGPGSQKTLFSQCSNCNLCVTACPSRCIASSASNVSAYLKLLRIPEETIYIASDGYEGDAHLRTGCFATLSWEYLACLGLERKVVFLTDSMPEPEPDAGQIWQDTLTRLCLFFGEEEYQKRFSFSPDPHHADRQEISRRELFQKAGEEIRSHISSFAPSKGMMDGLLYRHLLKSLLAHREEQAPFGWVIPMISSSCKGCGVCTRLCPQQALTVKKEENGFQVILYPFRCSTCRLCQKSCIHHAIEDFGVTRLTSLQPLLLFQNGHEKENP